MTKETLIEDIEDMDEIMDKTADTCDIWQDRFIYAMAKAIWHILQDIRKQKGL